MFKKVHQWKNGWLPSSVQEMDLFARQHGLDHFTTKDSTGVMGG